MQRENLYAVILAGGSGTRFWPLSRRSKPKQFLNITGSGTLLEETIRRIIALVRPKNIFIVTSTRFEKNIKKHCAHFKIPQKNILHEPSGKNTAPAVCWAAAYIHSIDPDAVMVVLPSDHLITKPPKFLNVLDKAVDLAARDHIVTIGIVPTRPETGYGYLKTVKVPDGPKDVRKVLKFTEKPSLAKAKRFLKSKYLWNSGMFVWKTSVILEEFKAYAPKIYRALSENFMPASIRKIWNNLPSISVDYCILEKTKKGMTVAAEDIGWTDLGSWESLAAVLTKDTSGNILRGDVLQINCKGSFIWSDKRVVAAVGLDDMVIVDTPDALLVCPKRSSQQVRDVVEGMMGSKKFNRNV